MKKIYENMEEELGEVGEKIQEIEIAIFSENNEDVLENLSRTNKELIDFRRSMRMHRDVFDSFERSAIDFFGNKFSYYTNTLLGDHERIWNVLESNKEILIDLRQTSDSLFSARTNSVIKTLTILTFITIPLSIISNFGQNAKNIPIIGYKSDFWIIIGFMVIIAIIMLVYFRFKKWL